MISLTGSYNWWDYNASMNSQYDDFIWDVNLIKEIPCDKATAEFFFTLRNLFNSTQYSNVDSKNPERWTEAGVRIRF